MSNRPPDPADDADSFESAPPPAHPGEPAALTARPRHATDDGEFELNPVVRSYDPGVLREAPEPERVREAVRQVLQEGRFLGDVTRELGLAPSSIYKWEKRYLDFVAGQTGSDPISVLHDWGGVADLPDEFRAKFAENWQQLLEATHAEAADFRQDPLEVFLHNSMLTGWLFRDGRLDPSAALGAAVGLLLTLLLGTFIYTKATQKPNEIEPAVAPGPAVEYTNQQLEDQREIDLARPAALAYLSAPGWEEKLKHVRQPERVRPLMKAWYATHSDAGLDRPELTHAMRTDNVVHLLVQFPLSDDPPIFLALVKTDEGYKVDWETSSGYQNQWWSELPEKRPTEPVRLRCMLAKDDYFNFGFADEEKWKCYSLGFPGGPVTLYGYAERGSRLANDLDNLLVFRDYAGVMVEVAYLPESRSDNQVRILRLLQEAWITDHAPPVSPPPSPPPTLPQ